MLRFIIPAILTLGLDLRVSCPVRIEIQPRADLAGVIDVEAHAETRDVLDALSFASGDIATIENQRHCHFRDDDHRSLELTIHVPPGLPIDIDAVIAGTYKIGDIGGPLKLKLSGAGEVHTGRLSGLDLDSAGVAEIRVDRLDGPGTATLRGGGAVTIGGGNMTSLHLDSHGAGAITVESGEIGTLDLSLAGAGDAAIHARVQDATLKIFGIGNIEIKHVSGTVHREVHGIGNIDIGS